MLLLVAIIAAIALTLRERKDSKRIDPVASRSSAKKADRVRIVKMAPTSRGAPTPPASAAPAPVETGRQGMSLGADHARPTT